MTENKVMVHKYKPLNKAVLFVFRTKTSPDFNMTLPTLRAEYNSCIDEPFQHCRELMYDYWSSHKYSSSLVCSIQRHPWPLQETFQRRSAGIHFVDIWKVFGADRFTIGFTTFLAKIHGGTWRTETVKKPSLNWTWSWSECQIYKLSTYFRFLQMN